MLRNRSPPTLILESDAAWDINLRPSMALLNKHFTRLLQNLRSRPLYNSNTTNQSIFRLPESFGPAVTDNSRLRKKGSIAGERGAKYSIEFGNGDGARPWYDADELAQAQRPQSTVVPDPTDPWHSEHWDVLSIGQCWDAQADATSHLRYADPFGPTGNEYWGQTLGHERVVHKSGGFVCTTAYAVTLRGAAKLLLRTALDLDAPVDLIIRGMIMSGELTAYSLMPTIMAQWNYVADIGMEQRGANSDIHGAGHVAPEGVGLETGVTAGWEEVKNTKTVWTLKPNHRDAAFKEMALQVAWDKIFSEEKDIEVGLY
jgi:hypothetical protein